MPKEKIKYNDLPGKSTKLEYNGHQVFIDEKGEYFTEVGATRFHCGDRGFDKLGTAKKIEDEKRAEQTRIQDEAVAKQMKMEEALGKR